MSAYELAVYTPSKNSDFAGNPFIECLPLRLTVNDFWDAVVDEAELPDVLEQLDVETLEQKASNIMKSVFPTSLYYDVYCDFLNVLKEGYQERNPLNQATIRWQNQIATANYERTRTTAPGLKFTGYSGMGKTTLFDALLTLVKPVIFHPKTGPLGKNTYQFVYIKINVPGEADSKSICLLIAAEIDKVLGTDYEKRYEKLTRKRCVSKLITLCSTLLIGVIIFDEIHNICFSAPNERKIIFTLFDRLSHEARVPTVKIGTTKANRLSEKEFTNARRLGVPHDWKNFKQGDSDWKLLVDYAWEYQLLPVFVERTEELDALVYRLTQGIPHCLFFLIEQTNKYCLRYGFERFTMKHLNHVFDTKFSIMKPAIIALKHGKIEAFDDLMVGGNQLEKEIKNNIKNFLKIAAEHKLKGVEAKAVFEQIEQYLPEYQLTKKEQKTIKYLEKQSALVPSDMVVDQFGYEDVPV